MIRRFIGVMLLVVAVAHADAPALAQTAPPSPQTRSAPEAAPKRAAGHATIALTRTKEFFHGAATANVEVNGKPFADLKNGQKHAGAVAPGRTTIIVKTWSHPGNFSVSFTAQPGRTYRFAVSPRSEHVAAEALFGIAGTLADAAANKNSGAFKLTAEK
jgi:hypothetical protein